MAVGDLVRWSNGEIPDIGQLIRIGSTCSVGFQVSVNETIEVEVRRRDLRPAEPEPGSRVYWEDANGQSRVGTVVVGMRSDLRIRDDDGNAHEIAKREALVRTHRPMTDATGLLAQGVLSDVADVVRRRAFWEEAAAQHSACAGFAALLSNNVDLYDYQLRTVLRVLADDTRRYLIADEVGLGKTIEAGLVIRQTQLEQPDATVAVALPAALIDQWCGELVDKFGVQAEGGTVNVLDWSDDALDSLGTIDLLVVDEAHQLAADPNGDSYRRIAAHARRAPAVLLLTATPTLRRDSDLLALLHLLDASAYPLDDLVGFAARIQQRVPIATWLAGFRPEFSTFALRRRITAGRELFADDGQTVALLDTAERALDDEEPARTHAVRAIRKRVGEHHRLHRRILRTRRESDPAAAAAVRGRRDPEVAVTLRGRDAALSALDGWRLHLAARTAVAPDAERRALVSLFALFVARAGSDLALLETVARGRATGSTSTLRRAGMSARLATAVLRIPLDADEDGLLLELADSAHEPAAEAHAAHVADVVAAHAHEQAIVVFSDFLQVRTAIALALAERLGAERVGLANTGSAEGRAVIRRFQSRAGLDLLVCGPSAEQGVDLAAADLIVHADLPLSPARLEQRIGRADRLGAGDPVRSLVFVDDLVCPSLPDAWFLCLRDGFGVFRASIADIQLAIVDETKRAQQMVLSAGAEGLLELTDAMPATLATERASSSELELLDAVSGNDEGREFVAGLRERDRAADALEEPVRRLLNARGGVFSSPGEGVLRLNWRSRGAQPPGADLRRHFDEPLTFDRDVARREGARLMRIGDSAFEAVAGWLACEDVGRVAALRRACTSVDEEQLFVGFGLLDVPDDDSSPVTTPCARSAWVRMDGEIVEDPELVAALAAPFGVGDTELVLFPSWPLESLVSPADWAMRCAAAAYVALAATFPGRVFSGIGDASGVRIDTAIAVVLEPMR